MASSISLSLPPLTSTISTKRSRYSLSFYNSYHQFTSSSIIPTQTSKFITYPLQENSRKRFQIWKFSATPEEVLTPETAIETTQQIISSDDGAGVSTTIQALLFIAFIGLTILTMGVVYIAVTDFLTKKDREKFEKEEEAKNSKKKGKKKVARPRNAPRGFGQKIEEEIDD